MRTLLREVATDRLTIALRGAPDESVMTAIFGGLSSRGGPSFATTSRTWATYARPTSGRPSRIIDAALKLEEEGKLSSAARRVMASEAVRANWMSPERPARRSPRGFGSPR